MGSNASKIWSIDYNDFPVAGSSFEKIKFLLRYAILAPSGHNTQPWLFKVGRDEVSLSANFKRRLLVMDPSTRELYLSLGACLANLKIAAEAFGISVEVNYFPLGKTDPTVAQIVFKGLAKARLTDAEMLFGIVSRRNNRENYLPETLGEDLIAQIHALATLADIRLDLVFDMPRKERLAALTAEGIRLAFANRHFREELASWIRNNFQYCEDGIPVNTTDMPAPSLIAAALIRLIDIGPLKAKTDRQKLLTSPTVAVVSSREDEPLAWIKSGELFGKILITAATQGVAGAVMAAAIEEGDLYRKVQEVLGTTFRPQILFRLGRPVKESRHAPRIPVEQLLVS